MIASGRRGIPRAAGFIRRGTITAPDESGGSGIAFPNAHLRRYATKNEMPPDYGPSVPFPTAILGAKAIDVWIG